MRVGLIVCGVIAWTAVPALAIEGVVVTAAGVPVANAQVSIVGRSGSSHTDAGGRFVVPDAAPPFTLVIVTARGEIFDPVEITAAAELGRIVVQPAVVETITVTTGAAPNIDAPPAAATAVVGRENLEQRKPEHLVDALERVPGIEARGEGPTAVPVIRGLAGGRTLILVDDARITTERRAGASATFLDPFTLATVELSRGAGSVAYGSDAFGGVIHARPRDPSPGDESVRYDISGGMGGTGFLAAGVEVTRDLLAGALLVALHARSSDGSEAGGGETIVNSEYADRGAAVRYLQPLANGVVRLAVATNQGRDVEAPSADARTVRTYYPEENSTRLTAGIDVRSRGGWEAVELRLAAGRYEITTNRERLPAADSLRQISSSAVEANDASFRLVGTRSTRFGALRAGVDVVSRFDLQALGSVQHFTAEGARSELTTEVSIEDARKIDSGLFAIVSGQAGDRLTVEGGIRGDRIELENRGGWFGDRERTDMALSGHVAATYVIAPAWTSTIQISSGYREPALSDRYFRGVSGRGFVVGNPDLEPERSLQFDAALRWQRGTRSVALFAYDYRIRHLVERFRDEADFKFRNRGEARIAGAEIEFALPLSSSFSLQGGAAIALGEVVGEETPLDDIAAPGLNLQLRWASQRTTAFIDGVWSDRDDRPGPLEVVRPATVVVDAGAGWKFSGAADLRLLVRNVFDERYAGSADENAALAPGRAFVLSLHGRV